MDRKTVVAFAAMLIAAITLIVDGAITLSGRSGIHYQAYRIFVSGGGAGMNHFVGRGEIVSGAVVAALAIGLWRDRRWGGWWASSSAWPRSGASRIQRQRTGLWRRAG